MILEVEKPKIGCAYLVRASYCFNSVESRRALCVCVCVYGRSKT